MARIFIYLAFLSLTALICSTKSQETLSCKPSRESSFTCIIDGSNISSNTTNITISSIPDSYLTIVFESFQNIKTDMLNYPITSSFKASQIIFKNSTVHFQNKSNLFKNESISLMFNKCTVALHNGSLGSLNITSLYFVDVKFKIIEAASFAGIHELMTLDFVNTNVTTEVLNAMNFLQRVKNFNCKNCSILDAEFSVILKSFKGSDELTVMLNPVTKVNCNEVRPLKLVSIFMSSNQLNGTFSTCGIDVVSIKHNQIEFLTIERDTGNIDATNNSISQISCDSNLDLKFLILSHNNLTDLGCVMSIGTLEELNIDSNNISMFKLSAFDELKSLTTISARDNPFWQSRPNLFYPIPFKSRLIRIDIDRFDFGHQHLKGFYPKLIELFHSSAGVSCEKYREMMSTCQAQNITLYFLNGTHVVDLCKSKVKE